MVRPYGFVMSVLVLASLFGCGSESADDVGSSQDREVDGTSETSLVWTFQGATPHGVLVQTISAGSQRTKVEFDISKLVGDELAKSLDVKKCATKAPTVAINASTPSRAALECELWAGFRDVWWNGETMSGSLELTLGRVDDHLTLVATFKGTHFWDCQVPEAPNALANCSQNEPVDDSLTSKPIRFSPLNDLPAKVELDLR